MKIRKPLEAFAVVMMLPATIACSPQEIPQSKPIQTPSLSPEIVTWLEQQSTEPPTIVVIAKDNSLSTVEHRTPPLTLEQLQPILTNISTHGGEIAFLGICDGVNEKKGGRKGEWLAFIIR